MSRLNNQDIEIVVGTVADLNILYKNFERDFPQNERKSHEHLEMLMSKNKYKLLLAKNKLFEEVIGYALIYSIDEPKMLWLDYMAIEEKYQDAGYGTLLFNKIIETEGVGKSGMYIEVEIPTGDDKNQERRLKFYERLGSKKISDKYVLPTVDGGLNMNIYYKPISNDKMLPKDVIKRSIASSYNYIHTDIFERDEMMKSFISEIIDLYLDR